MKMFRSLLIVSTLLILTACGGGGGTPTSVKVDSGATGVGWNIQTQVQIIDGSLGILQNNSISAMKNVSKSDFKSAVDGFEAISTLKSTVDNMSAADKLTIGNMWVTVEYKSGETKTHTLTEAIDIAYGMYTRYYEPYKTFWSNGANNGQVDDASSEYSALATKVNADKDKNKNELINTYKGVNNVVVTTELADPVTYNEVKTIDISTAATRTKSTYTETVTDSSASATDDWPSATDKTTADGCTCVRTYTNTYTITETYNSWREDTITYKRRDTITTYTDGSVVRTPGKAEVFSTVTGATQELVTAVASPTLVSSTYTSTSISTDATLVSSENVTTEYDETVKVVIATSETRNTDTDSTVTEVTGTVTKTYTDTNRVVTTYSSYRNDVITYRRIDKKDTYSDGTIITTEGTASALSTVTGSVVEHGVSNADPVRIAHVLISTVDSADNIVHVPYTNTDENLGTKTTGLSTDSNDFLTSEFYAGYTQNGYGNNFRDQLLETNIHVAWSRGWTGKDSKVGVIDTGVNLDHNDLDGQIADTKDYTGYGVTDAHGHGTHVAGTIASKKNDSGTVGVAFDSELYIVKNTHNGYSGGNWGNAMEWLKQMEVDVVNVSQNNNYDYRITTSGGSMYTLIDSDKGIYKLNDTYVRNNNTYATPDQWLTEGINGAITVSDDWSGYMAGSEIIVVNSAGNQGLPFAAQPGSLAPEVDADGNLKLGGKMIIVGNYRITDGARLGNDAGTICRNIVDNVCQDDYTVSDFFIRAPGFGVSASHSTDDGQVAMVGTSMSAPLVTGSIAVLHQMWPHMKGENLVQLVLTTADDTYSGYSVALDGHGRLDMDKATLPIGATGIPTDGRTTGYTISSNGYVAGNNAIPSSVSSLIVETSSIGFNREWLVPIAEASIPVDTAFNSFTQYAGLTGYGTNDFAIHLKENNTDSIAVTLDGTTFGYLKENGQYLGRYHNGMFGIGDTRTAFLQKDWSTNLNTNTLFSANVNVGYTEVDTIATSLINESDNLMSYGWKAQVDNKVNDNWSLTSFVGQPVSIFSGSMNINAPTERNGTSVSYTNTEWSQSAKVETDFGVSANFTNGNFNWNIGGVQRFDTALGDQFEATTGISWKF
jgi:subtilisin family serine protease